ncbi:MAG: hypothetical protein WC552_09595 [Candidatus Omnitrophota bacterium]
MDILAFIDLGIMMENRISVLYELAAEKASLAHPEYSAELKKLSNEEIGHANSLRMGRNFAAEMPDLFSFRSRASDDMGKLIEENGRIIEKLAAEKDLKSLLLNLLDLEKRFEKLHLTASTVTKDDSLNSLFSSLSIGDQNHIRTVSEILNKL